MDDAHGLGRMEGKSKLPLERISLEPVVDCRENAASLRFNRELLHDRFLVFNG